MPKHPRITPCLWFDTQAEEAARFYTGIFPNSKIVAITRYPDAGQQIHGKPAGSVMTVLFELDGQAFTALNGGPYFKFTEAVSFQIECDTQEEIDRLWDALGEGGTIEQCGWLRDRYGLCWQITPKILGEMMKDKDRARAGRVAEAMLQMVKLDIAGLQRAYNNAAAA